MPYLASRVGVVTVPPEGVGRHRLAVCPRCGVRRQVRYGRTVGLCADCKMIIRDLGDDGVWNDGT